MAKDTVGVSHLGGGSAHGSEEALGFQVMIYLSLMAAFFYVSYRRIWRDVDH
ncbi:MAG: hypothetical protein U1E87_04275 [Alphaproteobacteria bacterium]